MKYLHSLKTFALYSLSKSPNYNHLEWWKTTNSPEYKNKIYVVRILREIEKHLRNSTATVHTLDLCQALYETESVISGSLTLQCYLDEYFEDSDMDIFTFDNNLNFGNLKRWNVEPKPVSNYNSSWNVSTFNSIQVIYIQERQYYSAAEFIDTFDIDICKIIFDGRDFHFPKDYPTDIKNNRIAKVTGNISKRLYTRMVKYQERNFKVIFDKTRFIPYKLYNISFKYKFGTRDRFENNKDYKYYFEFNDIEQINNLKSFISNNDYLTKKFERIRQQSILAGLYNRINNTTRRINLNYYGNHNFNYEAKYDFTVLISTAWDYYRDNETIFFIIHEINEIK
jgi:hypothetical protein